MNSIKYSHFLHNTHILVHFRKKKHVIHKFQCLMKNIIRQNAYGANNNKFIIKCVQTNIIVSETRLFISKI